MILKFRSLSNSQILNPKCFSLKSVAGLQLSFCRLHLKSQLSSSVRAVLPNFPQTRTAKLATNLLFTTSGVVATLLWNYDGNGVGLRSKRSQRNCKLSLAEEQQKSDSQPKFDWKLVNSVWNSQKCIREAFVWYCNVVFSIFNCVEDIFYLFQFFFTETQSARIWKTNLNFYFLIYYVSHDLQFSHVFEKFKLHMQKYSTIFREKEFLSIFLGAQKFYWAKAMKEEKTLREVEKTCSSWSWLDLQKWTEDQT